MTACSLHTRTIAGWSCTLCNRALCPDCTGWRSAGQHRIELCMRCGGMARRLLAHRAERAPFRFALPGALVWPLRPGGLLTLAAVAGVVHLLELTGALGGFIGYGVALGYFFQLIRHAASGHDDVPAPEDLRGFFEEVLDPVLRAMVASMWFVWPLVLWFIASGHRLTGFALAEQEVHLTWVAALLLGGGALLYPMAIIAGALNCPLSTLLNPIAIVGLTFKLGRDYWLCAIFCLLCSLGAALLTAATGAFFQRAPIPLHGFFETAIGLYLPFVAFRAMGLLVRARGDVLGYGSVDSYRVPVLDAAPLHEVRPPPDQPVRRDVYVPPIELGAEAPPMQLEGPAESAASLGAPIPLLPLEEPRSQPRADPRAASRLARTMAARELPQAKAAWREGAASIAAGTLSAQSWTELAKALADDAARASGAERGELAELAVGACLRGLAVAPEGPLAPQIWLSAARLCDELLGDRARSDALLAQLAARFPESAEGQFAHKRLASGQQPAGVG